MKLAWLPFLASLVCPPAFAGIGVEDIVLQVLPAPRSQASSDEGCNGSQEGTCQILDPMHYDTDADIPECGEQSAPGPNSVPACGLPPVPVRYLISHPYDGESQFDSAWKAEHVAVTRRPLMPANTNYSTVNVETVVNKFIYTPVPDCGSVRGVACTFPPAFDLPSIEYFFNLAQDMAFVGQGTRWQVNRLFVSSHNNEDYLALLLQGIRVYIWEDIDDVMARPIGGGQTFRTRVLTYYHQKAMDSYSYLPVAQQRQAAGALASRRTQALSAYHRHILWHEMQHAYHYFQYFRGYERIVNDTARYTATPFLLNVPANQSATHVAHTQTIARLTARIQQANTYLDRCSKQAESGATPHSSFHASEYQINSYFKQLERCVMYQQNCPVVPAAPDYSRNFDCGGYGGF